MKKQAISLLFFILLQFVVGQDSSCPLTNYNQYVDSGRKCNVICSNDAEIITCLYKECIPGQHTTPDGTRYNVTCDAEYVQLSWISISGIPIIYPNIQIMTSGCDSQNVMNVQLKRCEQLQYTSSTGQTCDVSCDSERYEVIKCFKSRECTTVEFSYNDEVACKGDCEGGIESFSCPKLECRQKQCLWNQYGKGVQSQIRNRKPLGKTRLPNCEQIAILQKNTSEEDDDPDNNEYYSD